MFGRIAAPAAFEAVSRIHSSSARFCSRRSTSSGLRVAEVAIGGPDEQAERGEQQREREDTQALQERVQAEKRGMIFSPHCRIVSMQTSWEMVPIWVISMTSSTPISASCSANFVAKAASP